MKTVLLVLGSLLASTIAFSQDPVTSIESFQCHPRGATQTFIVWTEKTTAGQIVTVGKLGTSGVESIEKFTAGRLDTDDTVIIHSNDEALSLIIDNQFDGEFYSGELSLKKGDAIVTQELACESHTPIVADSEAPRSRSRLSAVGSRYVWTCTAAPYNNYNYRWFYGQHPIVSVANARALSFCDNFYGGPICVSSCR